MAKLNRDEILCDLLRTLISGWGKGAVLAALEALDTASPDGRGTHEEGAAENIARRAETLVAEIELPSEHRQLLMDLATRFDDGGAFPTLGDVRSFLLSHQQNATGLKNRIQGFKRMLPILSRMSPKGLERLIARAHHSGPADLGDISDAIRGAGEDLRGRPLARRKETVNAAGAPVLQQPSEAMRIPEAQASLKLTLGGDKPPEPAPAAQSSGAERQLSGLRPTAEANKKP